MEAGGNSRFTHAEVLRKAGVGEAEIENRKESLRLGASELDVAFEGAMCRGMLPVVPRRKPTLDRPERPIQHFEKARHTLSHLSLPDHAFSIVAVREQDSRRSR